MTRENIEALTRIIILQCAGDDEVAHLLSKILDGDASQRALIDQQAKEIARLREALSELYAQVKGECPSLLNEDSGGDAKLDLETESLLKEAL